MHVSYFAAALLLPLTLASPLEIESRAPDNAKKVLASLKALNTDITGLKKSLDAIDEKKDATTKQALAGNTASNKVSKEVQNNTKLANASKAFTAAESKSIFTYVNGTIAPATIAVLQDFIDHEFSFSDAGFGPTVKSGLQDQKSLVSDQSDALTAKTAAPYKAQGQAVSQSILDKFDDAISAYS